LLARTIEPLAFRVDCMRSSEIRGLLKLIVEGTISFAGGRRASGPPPWRSSRGCSGS